MDRAVPMGEVPLGLVEVESTTPGKLRRFLLAPVQAVAAGQTVALIESMKMEAAATAPVAGWLRECCACRAGRCGRAM
ncbi:hypothetical protein GC209_15765 [bacterium]|nr:hypothetical protein [bacterium]